MADAGIPYLERRQQVEARQSLTRIHASYNVVGRQLLYSAARIPSENAAEESRRGELAACVEGGREEAERSCQVGEFHSDDRILCIDLDRAACLPPEGITPLTLVIAEERPKPGEGVVQDTAHLVLVCYPDPACDDGEAHGLAIRI